MCEVPAKKSKTVQPVGPTAATEPWHGLPARLIQTQEEERRRISREIHDDLCQELAALAFDLDQLMAERCPNAFRKKLQDFRRRLAKLSETAHNLAYQLYPSTLEDLDLAASVRALCEDAMRRSGIAVKFVKRRAPPELPAEIKASLYRVAQQALRNAAKHSHAKSIKVELSSKQKQVLLSITDNGVGFDVASSRSNGRLGLSSMEERMRLVGGTLSIESAPGRGAKVLAAVPLSGVRS